MGCVTCEQLQNISKEALALEFLCQIAGGIGAANLTTDEETLPVSTLSVGLASIPVGASGAIIQVWSADIAYRLTGDPATNVAGANFRTNDGEIIRLTSLDQLNNFRAIRLAGTDAVLYIQYTS